MNPVRRQRRSALNRAAIGLGAAYLMALALIAFWPTPVDQGAHASLTSTLEWLRRHGAPDWLEYTSVEFTANIALFVPVGLLGVILIGARRWWLAILIGFLASCLIEFGQLMFLPARFASVNDVVANTSGAVLGTALALIVLVVVHLSPAPTPPPITRRVPTP